MGLVVLPLPSPSSSLGALPPGACSFLLRIRWCLSAPGAAMPGDCWTEPAEAVGPPYAIWHTKRELGIIANGTEELMGVLFSPGNSEATHRTGEESLYR